MINTVANSKHKLPLGIAVFLTTLAILSYLIGDYEANRKRHAASWADRAELHRQNEASIKDRAELHEKMDQFAIGTHALEVQHREIMDLLHRIDERIPTVKP